MTADTEINVRGDEQCAALPVLFFQVLAAYFAAMAIAWQVGFESIYGHPTPFYALWLPVFPGLFVPGVLLGAGWLAYRTGTRHMPASSSRSRWGLRLAGGIVLAGWGAAVFAEFRGSGLSLRAYLGEQGGALIWHVPAFLAALLMVFLAARLFFRFPGFGTAGGGFPGAELPLHWFLAGLVASLMGLACAVAMIRGGPAGISQAFQRGNYEYIGDIGVTRTIGALFTRYTSIQSYLSLHARAAPPGPIALLWVMSYVAGREPLPISLAVAFLGAVGVVPLYFWVREICGPKTAAVACVLYAAVPSIVLFTATCTEISFMPFLFVTLFCFDRAIHRNAWRYAIAAGVGFGVLSLLKFTFLGIGGYFALTGLWKLYRPETRRNVFFTALFMGGTFLAFHAIVWWSTGFEVITCFKLAKTYFDLDQYHLDQITPRFAGGWYRLLNPLTFFYFAGIPVSVLFLKRLRRPAPETRSRFLVFLLTLALLNLLYLGRGEGERSALYVFPFLVIPAAHLVEEMISRTGSKGPLLVTLGFLLFQTWLTESLFYTYW